MLFSELVKHLAVRLWQVCANCNERERLSSLVQSGLANDVVLTVRG